jgi:hypothetical protein
MNAIVFKVKLSALKKFIKDHEVLGKFPVVVHVRPEIKESPAVSGVSALRIFCEHYQKELPLGCPKWRLAIAALQTPLNRDTTKKLNVDLARWASWSNTRWYVS